MKVPDYLKCHHQLSPSKMVMNFLLPSYPPPPSWRALPSHPTTMSPWACNFKTLLNWKFIHVKIPMLTKHKLTHSKNRHSHQSYRESAFLDIEYHFPKKTRPQICVSHYGLAILHFLKSIIRHPPKKKKKRIMETQLPISPCQNIIFKK
jgi:hypothetical protein